MRLWDLIDQWADSTSSEDTKADLRERIRRHSSWRRWRGKPISHPGRECAALKRLLPKDTVTRHAWLFESNWIEVLPNEAEGEESTYGIPMDGQRLGELRVEAPREIWEGRSFDGVRALLEKS